MVGSTRRGFLRGTLGAAWTGATVMEQAFFRAAAARAQAPGAPAKLFEIEKIAEGAYLAVARPQALINSNAAIFVKAEDVLVVDTHSKPSAVAALVGQIRKEVTTKPVRYIVNSHFHWDHTQGTAGYRKLAPGAQILTSTPTARLLGELGAARLKESVEQTRKSLDSMRDKASAAKNDEERRFYQDQAEQMAAYLKEMQGYQPELPTLTFDRTLVIRDKSQELHLAFRGRAHTAGDVCVFSPATKALATGDALHGFMPFIADGYPAEWPRTLYGWATEFAFEHVLPGHAGAQHSRDRLYQMAGYIEELTDAVKKGKEKGQAVADLQKSILPASLKSFEFGGYGAFLAGSLIKYRLHPPGAAGAEMVADGVRTNVEHVYAALDRA